MNTKSLVKMFAALGTVLVLGVVYAQAPGRPNPLSRLRRPTQPGGAPQAPTPRGGAANANDAALAAPGANTSPGVTSIEFNAAAVDLVFKVYQDLKGVTVLRDPQIPQANITLQPKQGQELTVEEKIEAIETVLEMNGIHLEPYGEKFMRALPRKDVRKEGIPLIMDPDAPLRESTRVVSLMWQFKNIALEEAQKALEGIKSGNGVLNVFERTNTILITDTESNINRMREIARMIDVATPVTENVFVRQIQNASAADIKTVIDAIVQDSQKELEKNGKQANRAATPTPSSMPGRGLLGRNQPNNNQPINNASIVTQVSDADRGMIRGKVLTLSDERSNKLIIITSKANMDFFDRVIEQLDVETTPEIIVKVYRLKYAEAEDVADMINDLIGNAVSSKNGKGNRNQNSRAGTGGNMTRGGAQQQRRSVNQRSGEAKTGELSKENTTVLSDERINGLVVMTKKELLPTLEKIIESMDIKLSQVLIETAIIEVSLGDDLATGVNWALPGDKQNTQTGDTRGGYLNGEDNAAMQYMLGGGGSSSSAASILNALAGAGTNALSSISPAGSGLNWYFKSDALNIAAVVQASKSDNRTKYLASPVVMTLDNKEAVINATEMNYLLKGFTSSGNSYSTIAVPDYEQKELGIEIKVTPKINPNGTVMLTVETKYTQQTGSQTIKYATGGSSGQSSLADVTVPLTATREMSSDVLLENMQTVIFGGLVKTFKSNEEVGIPILKDIPWIGKWLFGSVTEKEKRNELLVFMTPYVMDEPGAAEKEARRRKNVISDPRAWEDNGWSASPLADPVSKKEQLRRLKDEAKKLDDDRRTKIAIEKWKVERAKDLQKMSKAERDVWLEMHKDELIDAELESEAEKLEKKMEDEKPTEADQDALKKLAAEVREKKLKEAEAELKKNDELTAADNERAKLDAEKAEAAKTQEAEKTEEK